MASVPVISSPADYSTQSLPFNITGTSDGVLVEARDDAGLLLPATENPVAVSGGAYTISITGTTGNRGAVYATAAGTVSAGGYSDDFSTQSAGALATAVDSTPWGRPFSTSPVVDAVNHRLTGPASGTGWARYTGGTFAADQWVQAQVSRTTHYQYLVLRQSDDNTSRIQIECSDASVTIRSNPGDAIRGSAVTLSATYQWIRAEVSGTTLTLKYRVNEGDAWTTHGTTFDIVSATNANGRPGVGLAGDAAPNNWIDNWSAGDL